MADYAQATRAEVEPSAIDRAMSWRFNYGQAGDGPGSQNALLMDSSDVRDKARAPATQTCFRPL